MKNLTELMLSRRSCRKFTEEPVSAEAIKELKRVALCAPTSKNCHSAELVFVTNREVINALAHSKDAGASFLEHATLAVVVLGDENKTDVWVEDTSIAATFVQLKAEDLGLGSCWVQMRERGFDDGRKANDIIRKLINAPENMQVECVIGIGHKMATKDAYTDETLDWTRVHDEKF